MAAIVEYLLCARHCANYVFLHLQSSYQSYGVDTNSKATKLIATVVILTRIFLESQPIVHITKLVLVCKLLKFMFPLGKFGFFLLSLLDSENLHITSLPVTKEAITLI